MRLRFAVRYLTCHVYVQTKGHQRVVIVASEPTSVFACDTLPWPPMEDAMAIRELALYCVLAGLTGAVAAEPVPTPDAWAPISHAAQAVTGRVTFMATRLTFQNGSSLTLVSGGQMLFRSEPKKKKVMADLYRVVTPDDPVLENGNKLCKGSQSST